MSSYKLPNEQVYNILNNKKGETSGALKIEFLSELSNIVREYRKENGLTNKQLADKCGITTSIMSRVESGYQNITIETISKVLLAIGYKIEFKKK